MPALQPVRGTQDLLPDEQRRHRAVTDTARAIAERYGYHEIATPIFEFTEVFARPIGETSDIVTKEMYTFADRGGRGDNAAAGIYRRHRPRRHLQRTDPSAAAALLRQRTDVPLRAAAEWAASASSTRSMSS